MYNCEIHSLYLSFKQSTTHLQSFLSKQNTEMLNIPYKYYNPN